MAAESNSTQEKANGRSSIPPTAVIDRPINQRRLGHNPNAPINGKATTSAPDGENEVDHDDSDDDKENEGTAAGAGAGPGTSGAARLLHLVVPG